MTHSELVARGEKWLKGQGCGIVFRDPFKAITFNGELPDIIGWRAGVSILIECKTSRADFFADKKKPFRSDPLKGMGDWRFYLSPPGIIEFNDLPVGWGLLHATNKQIKKVYGVPGNVAWYKDRPFNGNKDCENQMMYSALRRMSVRGHLADIYKKPFNQ